MLTHGAVRRTMHSSSLRGLTSLAGPRLLRAWVFLWGKRGRSTDRFVFLVDGFNLYHALDSTQKYQKYKWLDLRGLASLFIPKEGRLEKVFYFSALATWDQQKVSRHQAYIRALRSTSVEVVFGKFKLHDETCRKCGHRYKRPHEKETDVNIAVKLFQLSVQDVYDVSVLVSGDSDLIPAIKGVKQIYPHKKIGVLIPITRHAQDLSQSCDFHMKLKEKHLSASQFPSPLKLGDGQEIHRPASWA